ncbi:MAG: hypothetical protein AAF732_22280, partial [Pseudomonadota bacterium]
RKEWLPVIERLRGRREVPFQSYPLLVTFDDIKNPVTAREVDPNDLAATFGPGYALSSLTIEITDEPVTEGRVESVLAWLPSIRPNKLDGRRYETIEAGNRLANTLSAGSFSTEVGK